MVRPFLLESWNLHFLIFPWTNCECIIPWMWNWHKNKLLVFGKYSGDHVVVVYFAVKLLPNYWLWFRYFSIFENFCTYGKFVFIFLPTCREWQWVDYKWEGWEDQADDVGGGAADCGHGQASTGRYADSRGPHPWKHRVQGKTTYSTHDRCGIVTDKWQGGG